MNKSKQSLSIRSWQDDYYDGFIDYGEYFDYYTDHLITASDNWLAYYLIDHYNKHKLY